MSDKHPYTPAQGHVVQVIGQFRKSFPGTVTADTLKKLGFASKNESYVLNILRFLELIDQEGKKTPIASKIFSTHEDAAFSKELGKQVEKSYKDLFELQGDATWTLGSDTLISFFRTTDGTTEIVGKLQASTFQTLAAFSGHGDLPGARSSVTKQLSASPKKKTERAKSVTSPSEASEPLNKNEMNPSKKGGSFGLTVRIEINLPADGDQATYDRIFRSIRENLLNE